MDFLKKLINEQVSEHAVLNEKEETVEVEAAGVTIGNFLVYVSNFTVEGHGTRNFSHSHGTSYTTRGGQITEMKVGVVKHDSKESFRAEVFPEPAIDTDEVNVDAIMSAEIHVVAAPDGISSYKSAPIQDPELEEYLIQLVRSYLVKNLESVVSDTFNSEYDHTTDEAHRDRLRNQRGRSEDFD